MTTILQADGTEAKAPILLDPNEGKVIHMAFGMNEKGELPRVKRNYFKAGKVAPGSEKERILTSMAKKGLIELIGVVGLKANEAQKRALKAAIDAATGPVSMVPERMEAVVTKYGLACWLFTIRTSDLARKMAMGLE